MECNNKVTYVTVNYKYYEINILSLNDINREKNLF